MAKTIKAIRTGFVGRLNPPIWIYCNEKEYTGKGILLKCGKGCIHNPTKEQLKELILNNKR